MSDRPSVLFVCVHNAGRPQMAAELRIAQGLEVLTTSAVRVSDAVITVGCGDACQVLPGKRHEF